MPIPPWVFVGAAGAGIKAWNWISTGKHRRLSSAAFRVNGFEDTLCAALSDWKPEKMSSEAEYRDSLFAHLVSRNDSTRLEKEYLHLGSQLDIFLTWQGLLGLREACIELKFNLKDKSEFKRLLGQIADYEPSKRFVVIVLCGDTDPRFLARLQELHHDHLEGDVFGSPRMAIRCVE